MRDVEPARAFKGSQSPLFTVLLCVGQLGVSLLSGPCGAQSFRCSSSTPAQPGGAGALLHPGPGQGDGGGGASGPQELVCQRLFPFSVVGEVPRPRPFPGALQLGCELDEHRLDEQHWKGITLGVTTWHWGHSRCQPSACLQWTPTPAVGAWLYPCWVPKSYLSHSPMAMRCTRLCDPGPAAPLQAGCFGVHRWVSLLSGQAAWPGDLPWAPAG